jgi:diketogulonate reductase-like aldo/keto reductase
MYRSLTDNQRFLLKALVQHKVWYGGCGWIWSNNSTTMRMLDSLVKRGLAEKVGVTEYRPTETANRTFSK